MTYVRFIEDARGDLVEIEHYCSASCFVEGTGEEAYGHAMPCPEQADYAQFCPTCGEMSVQAIFKPEQYAEEGKDAGHAAGTWVFDGNTPDEAYARILKGIEDCDPEVMDMQPSPLSGEWAGDPTPDSLGKEWGLEGDTLSEACDIFEQAYSEAFWAEVERVATYQVTA